MSRFAVPRTTTLCTLALFFMFCTAGARAKTIYVRENGSNGNSGLSWSWAKKTITGALSASVSGDSIWVAKGVYSESVSLKAGVKLYGGFVGTEDTLAARPPFPRPLPDANASTIQPSYGYNVVTPQSGATPETRLDGFTVRNSAMAAVSCTSSSPTICNNTIVSNPGAGITCGSSSSPVIVNNMIKGNVGTGVYCNLSSATIRDNAIIANNAGAVALYKSSGTVCGNTIIGNAGVNAGGISCTDSGAGITNNVIAWNSSGVSSTGTTASPSLQNNCVYNPAGSDYTGISAGLGDISADPKVVSAENGQFHIRTDSPCVDAGLDTAVQTGEVDIDGQPRLIGSHVDIGADESDGTVWPDYQTPIVRVSPSGDDSNDGSSWASAKKTIQSAIDSTWETGGEIWVAAGVYGDRITLGPYSRLYGGFAGTETTRDDRDWSVNKTTIDPTADGTPVNVTTGGFRTNTFDGFIVRNARVTGIDKYGAVSCRGASPIIRNNVITASTGASGGGMSLYGSLALVSGNVITGNVSTGNGGGIYCSTGFPVLCNNTIVGNSSVEGGAIALSSSPAVVANNIIAFNSSGIYSLGLAPPDIRNNCVYNPDGYNYKGCSAGVGDISSDPRLASLQFGQLHIQPDSPCIDSGWNEAPELGAADIDAQPRIVDGNGDGEAVVDIGADESDGTLWQVSPVTMHVKPSGSDASDGLTWGTAKKTIQAGIDAGLGGGEVWVAAGVYSEHLVLRPFTYLYGGFAGTETDRSQRNCTANRTVVDAGGADSALLIRTGSSGAAVDGFTLRNGYGIQAADNYFYGGGVYCEFSSPTISHNIITNNALGAVCFSYGSAVFSNNIVTLNGGGIQCSNSSPTITGNTILTNKAPTGAINCSTASPVVSNNIIAFNTNGVYSAGGTVSLRNNCVYNPEGSDYTYVTPGPGDISADPKLVSLQYGRLHIQPDSPCIDAGWNEAPGMASTDIDDQARIQAGQVDIGADESDGSTWTTDPVVFYVSKSGDDANGGLTWQSAKRTVQAGLEAAAAAGGEVWVARGIYNERVTVWGYTSLYGGFAGTETDRSQRDWKSNVTVLDGDAAGTVVTVRSGDWLSGIDGFTIRNGEGVGGISVPDCSATISNNTIIGNDGEGIESDGDSIIANNVIKANTSYGLWCRGNEKVSNNLVIGNGLYGIRCMASDHHNPVIVNNTVVGNLLAGIEVSQSDPTLTNNIVAFNGEGIFVGSSSDKAVLRNNCVYNPGGLNYEGTSAGVGDISEDPKLAAVEYGYVHIQPDSPCIDAGLDGAVSPDWLDIDGQTRIQGAHVDIGADESDGATWPAERYIVRVSTSGDDANDGSSWPAAKKTLQAAIDAVTPIGGEVWAAKGTYNERITVQGYAHLFGGFRGDEDAISERDWKTNETAIDGGAAGTVVTLRSGLRTSSIDGFTIKNGKAGDAGGVYCCWSAPTIANNTITSNDGTGITSSNAATLITGNTITANVADGVYVPAYVTDFTIHGNVITRNGGNGVSGWGDIRGNTIADNAGYGVYKGSTITANTITGNAKGGILTDTTTTVSNNVVNGNSVFGIRADYGATATIMGNTVRDNAGMGIMFVQYDAGTVSGNTVTGNTKGIYCTQLSGSIVSWNRVAGNREQGIYCLGSSSTLANNRVENNHSNGIYIDSGSSLVVSGNTISGNGNSTTSGGGGIYSRGTVKVINNTIVGNTAYGGGGVYFAYAQAVTANNIVAFNSSGIDASGYGNTVTLQNNCVYNPGGVDYKGISPGPGDITADPLLVDRSAGDYHLGPGSPCVDAGLNTAPGIQSLDMDRETRVINGSVDIGADEMPPLYRAKTVPDGALLTAKGAVVTTRFDDCFYIETDDRTCGIRVVSPAYLPPSGSRVDVAGAMATDADGERQIAASGVTLTGSGNIRPLYIGVSSIGGGDWQFDAATGAGQVGVIDGLGLNNIGLLVKVCGRVTASEAERFVIEDGSAAAGIGRPSHVARLEVVCPPGVTPPSTGAFVAVTGVVSCEKQPDGIHPLLRLRGADDLQTIP